MQASAPFMYQERRQCISCHCAEAVYRQLCTTAKMAACLKVYLNIVLLKALLQMADAVLQAIGVDRQSYSVRVLCAMIQPMNF